MSGLYLYTVSLFRGSPGSRYLTAETPLLTTATDESEAAVRPPKRSTLVIILLVLAVATMSLTAAVAAASLGSTGGKITAPKLKPVPKVVKVKSKQKPPKNVKFRGERMPGGITTGTDSATGGAGEVVIPGVPAYKWRDGCGPTALGMVIGYYDGNGWPDLVPGDATSQTTEVSQSIASHGTLEAPGNYEDYALPMDSSTATVLADRSAAPAGDEHAGELDRRFHAHVMERRWPALRVELLQHDQRWRSVSYVSLDSTRARRP